METRTFLRQLKSALEIKTPRLEESTALNELDEFDSLAIMELVAFIDENFSIQLDQTQLKQITTVRSLMEMIGLDRFQKELK